MFKEAIQNVVDKTDGGVAGLLMDAAGVTIESYVRKNEELDIHAVGVELGVVLGAIQRALESLEAGGATEVTIGTDRLVTLIRPLKDGYFLAMALHPEGNTGKGRYLMRLAMPQLLQELM